MNVPSGKTTRRWLETMASVGLLVALIGCTGTLTSNGDPSVDPEQMEGAGGRDISEYWPSIEIPLSENTRMLSFEMMQAEVMRATGHSWELDGVDQWERNRGALGGADYVTTFADDLTPSQQRVVLWRKMAFQVCGDLVDAEAGAATRTVFTEVDPGASFDSASQATTAQIRTLFFRFFLAEPDDSDVTQGANLLSALSQTGADGPAVWGGLCVAYLGSMRFLTY